MSHFPGATISFPSILPSNQRVNLPSFLYSLSSPARDDAPVYKVATFRYQNTVEYKLLTTRPVKLGFFWAKITILLLEMVVISV